MAMIEVSIQDLLQSREKLVKEIRSVLTDKDKKFLLGFVENKPDWTLAHDAKIKDYPSVKWKMFNQEKMSQAKRTTYLKNVEKLF